MLAASRFVHILFVVVALCGAAAALADDKAVFQVSENDEAKWNLALNNARNMQRQTQGTGGTDIEIVAYGPGIQLLKAGSPIAARISETVGGHIKVVACKVSMAGAKLTEAEMLSDIGYVPSGVVELMRKQQQGYAYIRP